MNVEIGTEAAQFPEKEYINGIFLAVQKVRVWDQSTVFSIQVKWHSHLGLIKRYVMCRLLPQRVLNSS
jgi:hypothetical protein